MSWKFWKKQPVIWDFDGVCYCSPEIRQIVEDFATRIKNSQPGGIVNIPPELGEDWKAVAFSVQRARASQNQGRSDG